MSGRSDKNEKTSGSKMLKKAQSFREDIRNRIRRRPSTGVQQMFPDGKGKRKGDGSVSELNPADDDMESLKAALAEVNKTLIFIKAVVSKGKLEVLPGSASVILETVMQIFTLLRYPKLAHDSNSLVSSQSKVCQHLAKFIQWTDDSLVGINKTCDQQQAHNIIDTLLEGIQELTTLGMEKMSQKKSSLQAPVTSQPLPSPSYDGCKHGPLPDIPLTPREQEILAQTSSEITNYDNITSLARNSNTSDNIASLARNSNTSSVFSYDPSMESTDTPPPKPPLPPGCNVLLHRNCPDVDSIDGQDPLLPPPLPQKKRSPSSSTEILETLSGRVATPSTPTSAVIPGGHGAAGGNVFNHNNMQLDMGPPTSRSSLPSSTSSSSFPLMNHRSTGDLITSSSSSSSSSLSSAHWQEQNLEKGKTSTQTFSRTVSDSKLVSSTVVSGKVTGKACDEINELTSQIKQLTNCIEEIPPPLPAKKSQILHRLNSQYDNVPELLEERMAALSSVTSQQRTVYTRKVERISSSSTSSSQSSHSNQNQRSMQSFLTEERASSQETYSSSETFSSTSHSSTESLPKPPPLPPKKKHVQAYVQMFGAVTQPSALEESISRHSIQFYEAQWQQHQRELFYPRSNTISVFSDISSDSSLSGGSMERLSNMQSLPVKMKRMSDISHGSQFSTESSQSDVSHGDLLGLGGKLPSDSGSVSSQLLRLSLPQPVTQPRAQSEEKDMAPLAQPEIQKDSDSDFCELNLLDDVEVEDQLILKKQEEDGPDVRGGAVDALIVHATQAGQREFIYQEAFLTTYRMFISPKMLMDKLLYRFQKFQHATDQRKKVAHNNAFSLLIRVVDELGVNELDSVIVDRLMNLVYDLICERELNHARLLRKILLEKCEKKQVELAESQQNSMAPIQTIELSSSSTDLLGFKAHDVAEQMTLLDAQLFQKIEIPEVLMWAREQSEELSPHLTTFTEHFNKMSYWCRTQILTQDDPKERERYLLKFIKIMRHLRKLHNFNSYLAILSALDSAPVRRLEWQKQNIEALQEFCQLIDSSSSFRAYRQALAETEPPCIPYLGLILQDLTFVNIGNPDKLTDGSVNFAKHWQQFNILDSMRRFRASCYQLKRHEKVMNFLNNFEGYLNEDILWQISQKIKPRPVGHRKQNSIS
ncbi:hypothetical protein BsWGS_22981 [Bradybaena similaris]